MFDLGLSRGESPTDSNCWSPRSRARTARGEWHGVSRGQEGQVEVAVRSLAWRSQSIYCLQESLIGPVHESGSYLQCTSSASPAASFRDSPGESFPVPRLPKGTTAAGIARCSFRNLLFPGL